MVLLSDAVRFKKLDTRLVERNIARGGLTEAEFQAAVADLPDDAENADWVSIDSFAQEGSDSAAESGSYSGAAAGPSLGSFADPELD
jgi:hypothetical protein